jgi:hypothetical protein
MPITQEDMESQRQYAQDANLDADTLKSYTKEAIDYLRYMGTPQEADKKRLAEERVRKELDETGAVSKSANAKNNNTTASIKAPKPMLRINGIQPLREETPDEIISEKIEAVAQAVKDLAKDNPDQKGIQVTPANNTIAEPLIAPVEVGDNNSKVTSVTEEPITSLPVVSPVKPTEDTSKEEPINAPIESVRPSAMPEVEKSVQPIIQNITVEQERELREEYPFFDFDTPPKDKDSTEQLQQFKRDLYAEMSKRKKTESVANTTSLPTAQPTNPQPLQSDMEPVSESIEVVEDDKKNANLTLEQKQELREEYSKFDFDRPPKDDDEAKRMDRFERDLYAEMSKRKSQESNSNLIARKSITFSETPNESPVATVTDNTTNEPVESKNTAQDASISSVQSNSTEASTTPIQPSASAAANEFSKLTPQLEATTATSLQSLEPVETPTAATSQPVPKATPTDTIETSIKGLVNSNNNIVTVLYGISNTINEILKNMGSLGDISDLDGQQGSRKNSAVTTINDGSINMYRGSFRPQNNVNNTMLRPTTPGFTV